MYTNAYIISTGKKECILLDPGADPDVIIQRLEAMNLVPRAILFTHGHIDHTSGAARIVDYYRERNHHVTVGIHESDAAFLGANAGARNRSVFAPFGPDALRALGSFGDSVPEPEFLVSDGDAVLDTDLVVMHTPGHTSGSTSFFSESRQAVFSGDTLFFNQIGRTDVPDGDTAALQSSVQKRLFELPPDTRVFPGHGPLTSIEREIKTNPMVSDGATI